MEEYIEVQIFGVIPDDEGFLTAALTGAGYDSFAEEGDTFKAYIPKMLFNEKQLEDLLKSLPEGHDMKFIAGIVAKKNWNEVWEKNFEPVDIDGRCFIRAPFHESRPEIPVEIIIEPKMSFGTAHHETTFQMISDMLNIDFRGRSVLDMGCGTAVLAILASKLGAERVYAIDNDPWAYENALENTARNNASNVLVIQGGKDEIPPVMMDIIVANINRNILLEQLPAYSSCLSPHGILLISGFYEDDLSAITVCAENEGLHFRGHRQKNQWVVAHFVK